MRETIIKKTQIIQYYANYTRTLFFLLQPEAQPGPPQTSKMEFHSSTIDLFLTNKPKSFQETNVIETGLSDHHKLILFKILLRKA